MWKSKGEVHEQCEDRDSLVAMASLPNPKPSASFWHSEPSDFLLGHQTSISLPEEADVVIVGSGITGASAARFLAEDERAKGSNVVMLEAREACWGATGRVRQINPTLYNYFCRILFGWKTCLRP